MNLMPQAMAPRELSGSVGVLVRDAVLFRTVLCFCDPVTCQALAQTSVALRVIVRTQCDPVWRFFAKQRWGSGVEVEEAKGAATAVVAPKTPDEAVITAQSNWFSFYQRRYVLAWLRQCLLTANPHTAAGCMVCVECLLGRRRCRRLI